MALRVVWALLIVAVAGLVPQTAGAQGFFQYFFGPEPPPRPRWIPPRFNAYSPYDGGLPQDRPETFRTLCVRTCDGYYFPISFSTTRSAFGRDADRCTASCGSDARLFYHPNPGGKVEDMVDLSGLGYASLPNAFKYRQSLASSCACKPEPWSEAELERHRNYVRNEHIGGKDGRSATGAFAAERRRPASRYDLHAPARRNGNEPAIPFSSQRGSPAGLWR